MRERCALRTIDAAIAEIESITGGWRCCYIEVCRKLVTGTYGAVSDAGVGVRVVNIYHGAGRCRATAISRQVQRGRKGAEGVIKIGCGVPGRLPAVSIAKIPLE